MTQGEGLIGHVIEQNRPLLLNAFQLQKERWQVDPSLFPRLAERRKQMAGTMSGGEQRMLEIGRALMLEPRLVLMDEPSAGLAPLITRMIFENIERLNKEIGLTVLMIEQNARQGLQASHRG